MKRTEILAITLITAIMVLASMPLEAQPPPPPGPGTGGPIDGGVLSLLFGAVAYGYRQLKQWETTKE